MSFFDNFFLQLEKRVVYLKVQRLKFQHLMLRFGGGASRTIQITYFLRFHVKKNQKMTHALIKMRILKNNTKKKNDTTKVGLFFFFFYISQKNRKKKIHNKNYYVVFFLTVYSMFNTHLLTVTIFLTAAYFIVTCSLMSYL